MSDFLLELLSEEIPARMQDKARADLERLFTEKLAEAGLKAARITTYATPRRLALIAHDLPEMTEAVSEERKGPRADAPEQAIEGFKRGLPDGTEIESREDAKGAKVLFAVIAKPGLPTSDVLASAIPAIIRAFPWPKSMRWGAASISTESLRWVRPLQGIVALLGDDVVACEVDGIVSGSATLGHRFHHSGNITIGNAADYAVKLRAAHVIVDQDERRDMIRRQATDIAMQAGLDLIEDEALVAENAGLTEWPVPLLGRFDAAFLEVPPEVIQLTARVNQKYFVCRDAGGKLANAFVCTANIDAHDGGAAIIAGNEKVLAARLSDAQHFWEEDQWHHDPVTRKRTTRYTLDEHAERLKDIVFHEKLGTVADKVERVAKLARWLVEEGIVTSSPLPFRGGAGGGVSASGTTSTPHPNPSPEEEGLSQAALADQAERAAELSKADLVTGMVGEFPELQGVMGGYYARAQGEPDAVADAIRDHYKPVGQGDDVPTAPVTVAVSLADKLDTLAGFFYEDMLPTGSKDPFALRRAAIGILQILQFNALRLQMWSLIGPWSQSLAIQQLGSKLATELLPFLVDLQKFMPDIPGDLISKSLEMPNSEFDVDARARIVRAISTTQSLLDFFADRLKVQQKEAGVRHDLIDAVFALGGEDDLVRLLARVKALQSFIETPDGANLLAGYKRAANILKKELPLPGAERAGQRGIGVAGADSQPSDTPTSILPLKGEEGYAPEPAETALIAALDIAEPKAEAAIAAEDFAGAMAALASLRAPIDAFFEGVMINDPDPAKRDARLGLLARFRDAAHRVADFSKIEG